MPDSSCANIGSIISAAAAVVSAITACIAVYFSIRSSQRNKKSRMNYEYGEMSEIRNRFWKALRALYNIPHWVSDPVLNNDSIEIFIRRAGAPPNIRGELIEWSKNNQDKLGTYQKKLWEFVCRIYPEKGDPNPRGSNDFFIELNSDHSDLSWFWDNWGQLLKTDYIVKRFRSSHTEILILTWLELALAQRVGEPGEGKVELFKIAKEIHEKRLLYPPEAYR